MIGGKVQDIGLWQRRSVSFIENCLGGLGADFVTYPSACLGVCLQQRLADLDVEMKRKYD